MTKIEEPYHTAVDNNGCDKCGHGREYVVVGPNGDAGSQSFDNEEDAAALAAALNEAYFVGKGAQDA